MEPNRDIDALVDEIDSALASLQKKSAKKIVSVRGGSPTFPGPFTQAPNPSRPTFHPIFFPLTLSHYASARPSQ